MMIFLLAFLASGRSGVHRPDPHPIGALSSAPWTPAQSVHGQPDPGNALRVTVERSAAGAAGPLVLRPIFGKQSFTASASAVAMTNPRDIAFVVDLSGSMNNDTEPCWATSEINNAFGRRGYPTIGNDLMQQLYDDFGYGTFPGTLQYVGQPLGVAQDQYAYAELTKNSGPLTQASIAAQYRISNTDSEATRKHEGLQVDHRQPDRRGDARRQAHPQQQQSRPATPIGRSTSTTSCGRSRSRPSSPKGKPRPSYPVTLPPSQSSDRIDGIRQPLHGRLSRRRRAARRQGYRNKIGYRTYVQFMMDFGRDGQPASGQYVPLSTSQRRTARGTAKSTDGGTFSFPPREQPTHAARRALIAAIQVIKERNAGRLRSRTSATGSRSSPSTGPAACRSRRA